MPCGSQKGGRESRHSWLDGSVSGTYCVIAWIVASIIFLGMVAILGGPSEGDGTQTVYSTWSIAHGSVACADPPTPSNTSGFLPDYLPLTNAPPLWPLISGGLASAVGLGHTEPFPSSKALGPNCARAYSAIYRWADSTFLLVPTVRLGYVSWVFLLAGFISLLRASGRGRTRWEVLGVLYLALVPLVWAPLLEYFHPQDLVAVGLSLGGLALILRQKWTAAGVLLGLAVTSQQFALLVLLPVLVLVAGNKRMRVGLSAIVGWSVISLPILLLTWGQASSAVFFGTGDAASLGGTVLWEIHLPGRWVLFASRVMPLLVSVAGACWVRHRLGERSLHSIPLVSLVGASLALRLVFEKGLFSYKFMALSVMLVALDVVGGRLRGEVVVWISLVTLAFDPVPIGLQLNAEPWGRDVRGAVPLICMAFALLWILSDAIRRRFRWYVIAFFFIAVCAFMKWPPWLITPLRTPLPKWLWQLILVPSGFALVLIPLTNTMNRVNGVSPKQRWRALVP